MTMHEKMARAMAEKDGKTEWPEHVLVERNALVKMMADLGVTLHVN